MEQRGLVPHTRILNAELVPASADIADALRVEPGTELASVERLRLADGEPMSIESSFLIHKYCPRVLERYDGSDSLRKLLENEFGIRLMFARQKIRAVSATRAQADPLGIDLHAPLLYIERISYMQNEQPVEYLRTFHRGDRYTLFTELRG
jgi:GntR family transcriptional regulator